MARDNIKVIVCIPSAFEKHLDEFKSKTKNIIRVKLLKVVALAIQPGYRQHVAHYVGYDISTWDIPAQV